jgi:hypothetical protein
MAEPLETRRGKHQEQGRVVERERLDRLARRAREQRRHAGKSTRFQRDHRLDGGHGERDGTSVDLECHEAAELHARRTAPEERAEIDDRYRCATDEREAEHERWRAAQQLEWERPHRFAHAREWDPYAMRAARHDEQALLLFCPHGAALSGPSALETTRVVPGTGEGQRSWPKVALAPTST